ncbi:MAG TPA: ATP-binding protein [Methylomirabilota bacterium]|jgi:two-component system osmolarity sensor histidine kinase EnvZ|nr:ATP-binding protein [Methylomirabilota bacterium]
MASLPQDLDRLLHDLRGPLNAMAMHLEVLKRTGPGEPEALQRFETIQAEMARLAALLPAAFDVLALERRDVAPLNLKNLVRRALEEHGLGGVTLADGAWADVRGDARLLGLAVGHLVRNALAATAAAGGGRPAPHLSASAAEPGRVNLVIRDWGTGLRTTNSRALIRLSLSKTTGRPAVGLVTVERVARLHGGTVEFHAPADGGAEVRLTLPAA